MSVSAVTVTTDEDLAMYHAIKKLAPDEGMELIGAVLYGLGKNDHAGVTVSVDWPMFLGCSAAQFQEVYLARLAEHQAEQAAEDAARLRSEQTKAGLARRKAAGLPIGRQLGAKDGQRRKRSGYVARYVAARTGGVSDERPQDAAGQARRT